MVVVASVGEERLHGVDQEVVVDQTGGYVGGQKLLDFFENGVFSRAREAIEDNDLAARGSLDRFAEGSTGCRILTRLVHLSPTEDVSSLSQFRLDSRVL